MMMHSRFDETKSGSFGWSKMSGSGYPYVASDSAAKGENSGRTIRHYWTTDGEEGTFKNEETTKVWLPHRQRAVVVKKLPLPIIYSPLTGMDWTGEHGKIHRKVPPADAPLEDIYPDKGYVKDKNITTSEIDMTFKVDELTAAPFYVNAGSSWDNPNEDGLEFMSMDTRSIAIMLGTRPPRDAESFFDYFYNTNCDSKGWNSKGSKGGTGFVAGSEGDRDGLSTGMLIVRPPYTDYTYENHDTELDGALVEAKGVGGVGKGYQNGAEKFTDSTIGRNFVKDGLVCLPFGHRLYVNKVNGHNDGLDGGELSSKNRWSIMAGTKSDDGSRGKDTFGGGGEGDKDNDYNSSHYYTTLRARFSQDDLEDFAIPLPDREWLRVRIFLNGDDSHDIRFQIEDAKSGNVLGRSNMAYVENKSIWTGDALPLYLSIWCNNHPGTVNTNHDGDTAQRWWGEAKSTRRTTQTKLFVDEIKLKNFNMSHNNASIDNANTSKSPLKIKRNVVTNAWMQKTMSPTYLSFGFENATDLMDGATYLLFNGLSGTTSTPTAIGNNYIRATVSMTGWTVDGVDAERLGGGYFDGKCHASGTGAYKENDWWMSPFKHIPDSYTWGSTANHQVASRGLSINGSETGGAGAFWDGTKRSGGIAAGTQQISMSGNATDTENFSYKGLLKFNYDSGQVLEIAASSPPEHHLIHDYAISKRENDYVAARVIDVDMESGEITVDDPSVLQLKEGLRYRLYFRGGIKKANSNNISVESTYQDVYLSEDAIKDNIVKIKSELNRYFINGTRNGIKVRDNLWISPLLNWLIIEALPYDSSNEKIEDRTYRSVVEVNRGNTAFPTSTDYGTTYNESLYNDGIYQNSWSLDFTVPDSQVITDVDYGFGSLVEEGVGGGELSKVKISDSNLWYQVDLSGAINVGEKREGDVLTTLMAPQSISSFIKTTIATTESTTKATVDNDWYWQGGAHYNGVFRPFLLTRFHDSLPIIEDFELKPAEGREFYPKFNWKCNEKDLWYGFILVDDKLIQHQYQNAVLHMPLNTPKTSNNAPNVLAGKKTSDIPDWYSWVNDVNGTSWAKKMAPETPFSYPLLYQLEDLELAFDPEGLSGWCHRFTQPLGGEAVNALNLFSTNAEVETYGFRGTCPQKEMSLILHVTPDYRIYPSTQNQMLFDDGGGVVDGTENGVPDQLKFFKVYIDVDGYVAVEICPTNCQETSNEEPVSGTAAKVVLKSASLIPSDGITPTNIIVTLDAGLKRNNLKLFINGKLEDTTGKSYTDMTLATSNRWPFNTKMATGSTTSMITVGNVRSLRKVNSQLEPFTGRMEEVVYYNKCIYPVDVKSGEFILEKPLKELSGNNQSKSYTARLFVKDYHNIRGTTSDLVATSPNVSWRKSVPLFTEASD